MRVVRFAETADIVRSAGIETGPDPSPAAREAHVPAPAWMTAAEARRFRRLRRADDRAAYAAAHLLVRLCAAELLAAERPGVDALDLTLVQHCRGCGRADHGPPRILESELHVSLSHARNHVAAIASRHPCGIDVEHARGPVVPRALNAGEARWVAAQPDRGDAFVRLWTRKEALVKAGLGSLDRPADIEALRPGTGVRLGEWSGPAARGAWCEREPGGAR